VNDDELNLKVLNIKPKTQGNGNREIGKWREINWISQLPIAFPLPTSLLLPKILIPRKEEIKGYNEAKGNGNIEIPLRSSSLATHPSIYSV